MIVVPQKSTNDDLSANEYSLCTSLENQNAVLNSGQILGGPTDQLTQAMLRYNASGNEYIDSGAANAYVLNSRISTYRIQSYIDGLKVNFLATHTNTGAITVNVNSLGVKDVVFPDGNPVTTGLLALNKYITFIYDLASDEFIYVSSTDGADSDLDAYKAEIANQIVPVGSSFVGYVGETVETALDNRATFADLIDPTGATLIGKDELGAYVNSGATVQAFMNQFFAFSRSNSASMIFSQNLTFSKPETGVYRFTFVVNPGGPGNYFVFATTVTPGAPSNVVPMIETKANNFFDVRCVRIDNNEPTDITELETLVMTYPV